MSSVQTNLTTDTITLSIIYNNDYTLGITGIMDGGTGILHGLSGTDLAPKGYVDYVFSNNTASSAIGLTGLYQEIMAGYGGDTGNSLIASISTQYDTIKEISDKLLVFGDTGTTGTILYNILATYSQENTWRKNDLTGYTGKIQDEKNRGLTGTSIINTNINNEQANFNSAIATEATARKAADAGLTGGIATEASSFNTSISAQATARQAADAGLTGGIATEASSFNSSISAQATARQAADAGLTGGIATEASSFNSSISAQATARQSSDAGLTASIESYKTSNNTKLSYMTFSGQTGVTGNYSITKDIVLNSNKVTTYTYNNTGVFKTGQGSFAQEGQSVCASYDGTVVMSGSYGYNSNAGAVCFYRYSNGSWNLVGAHSKSYTSAYEGYSVALSGDGSIAVAGAPYYNTNTGAVVIRKWNGSTYSLDDTVITGAAVSYRFGYSVSISADGNTLVVGAPDRGSGNGGFYIYIRNTTTGAWTTSGLNFSTTFQNQGLYEGGSVAISPDGNTICTGGGPAGAGTNTKVSVWVRTPGTNTFTEQATINKDASLLSYFGVSMSFSYDGNTLAVGAGYSGIVGSVSIFTRSGTTWTQKAILVGSGYSGNAAQGQSVSLSYDGTLLASGGLYDSGNNGAVWMFQNNAGTWSQIGSKITGPVTGYFGVSVSIASKYGIMVAGARSYNANAGATVITTPIITNTYSPNILSYGSTGTTLSNASVDVGAMQGSSVDITPDGNTVVIGNAGDAATRGSISVYQKNVSGQFIIQTSDSFVYNFYDSSLSGPVQQGCSVAINKDATTIVAGACNPTGTGAATIYTKQGGLWTKLQTLNGTATLDLFGTDVSISADASVVAISAPGKSYGVIYIYTLSAGTYSLSSTIIPTGVTTNHRIGKSIKLSGDGNYLAASDPIFGCVLIFAKSGGTWSQQSGPLTYIGNNSNYPYFGASLALSYDGSTLAVGSSYANAGVTTTGSSWVFNRVGSTWSQTKNLFGVDNTTSGVLMVAGGYGTNSLAWSTDGKNWTASSNGNSIFTNYCYTVAWNGQLWVAGGYGTNQLAWSTDGKTWTGGNGAYGSANGNGNSIFTSVCQTVAWNGQLWVAGGAGTNVLAWSTDGKNWTASSNGNSIFTNYCYTVAWNGQIWVVGGQGTNTLAWSTDGKNWTAGTGGANGNGNSIITGYCYTVAWNGQLWVAGGYGTNVLAWSTDGKNWTGGNGTYGSANGNGNSIFTNSCRTVAWNGQLWVAGGNGTNVLAWSTDGKNWTASSNGNSIFPNYCYTVAWNGQIWVVGGQGTNTLAWSTDGKNWTAGTGGANGNGNSIFTNYCNVLATVVDSASTDNALMVAGGYGTNQLAWSTDGKNWTASSNGNSIFTTVCYTVAWNGQLWVAGGGGTNQLAWSTDGKNWTAGSGGANGNGNSIFTNYCNTVAWNGQLWVAGGNGTNVLAWSTDGKNWTAGTGGANGNGNSIFTGYCNTVAWNGQLWVAGGGGTNTLAWSTDGKNWTAGTGGANGNGNSIFTGSCTTVAWNGQLWVAGGYGTNFLAWSTDGKNWTASTNGNSILTSYCYTVAWNGQLWVAGGAGTNQLAWSTDGKTWTGGNGAYGSANGNGNSIFTSQCNTVAWNGQLWVAGGSGSNQMAWSVDGKNWTGGTGANGNGNSILTTVCNSVSSTFPDSTLYKVPIVAGGSGTNTLAYSYDGISFTGLGSNIFTSYCNTVAWNGQLWVAGGYGTNVLAWSTDGKNWTGGNGAYGSANGNGNSIFTGSCYTVAWNGQLWVAGGNGTNFLAWSTDGKNWTASSNGNSIFTNYCYTVAWNGQLWVAGGNGTNVLAWSTDGKNWTAGNGTYGSANGNGNSIFTNSCRTVAWNGQLWVAGGSGSNQMAWSVDGKNWTASSNGNSIFTNYCYTVAWNGQLWVAGGAGTNVLAWSTDGKNWTAGTGGANGNGNSIITGYCSTVAWNGQLWVAGGAGTNSLAWSTDGKNWTAGTGGANGNGNSIFTTVCYTVGINFDAVKYNGCEIGLSYDGNALVMGRNVNSSNNGAIWSFGKDEGVWSQAGNKLSYSDIIIGSTNANGKFGSSLALAGYSKTLAVGSPVGYSYPKGNVLVTSSSAVSGVSSSVVSPYYLQLSDNFRITPSDDFTKLRFQYYKNVAGVYTWTDIATLNNA